jgi:hypothetical protein
VQESVRKKKFMLSREKGSENNCNKNFMGQRRIPHKFGQAEDG